MPLLIVFYVFLLHNKFLVDHSTVVKQHLHTFTVTRIVSRQTINNKPFNETTVCCFCPHVPRIALFRFVPKRRNWKEIHFFFRFHSFHSIHYSIVVIMMIIINALTLTHTLVHDSSLKIFKYLYININNNERRLHVWRAHMKEGKKQ